VPNLMNLSTDELINALDVWAVAHGIPTMRGSHVLPTTGVIDLGGAGMWVNEEIDQGIDLGLIEHLRECPDHKSGRGCECEVDFGRVLIGNWRKSWEWRTNSGRVVPAHTQYARRHQVWVEVKDGKSEYAALYNKGSYTIQVALHLDDEDLVSAPLRVRVAPPRGYDEEHLAQDVFSDQVGRVLAFDGSGVLDSANDVLREVTERLPDRRVAVHARIALGNAVAGRRKRLEAAGGVSAAQSLSSVDARIVETPADPAEVRKQLEPVLSSESQRSAETLGHIDYHDYADRFARWLSEQGETQSAADVMDALVETLAKRGVRADVLAAIKTEADAYRAPG